MRLQPLHNRVIVKRLKEKHTTSSGIVIPNTAAEKTYTNPPKKNVTGKSMGFFVCFPEQSRRHTCDWL